MLRTLCLLACLTAPSAAQGIERVSVGPGGQPGDGDSWESTLSADGRKVVFVSTAPDGTQADGDSGGPALSADGRWVAFYTWAGNLVPGDTNGHSDVYLRELATGAMTRISLAPGGAQPNGASQLPAVSADARFVAFSSDATNLVRGDPNGLRDFFVADLGGACLAPETYCAAKANSLACLPAIATLGVPSLSTGGFTVTATQLLNNQNGLLCVAQPARGPLLASGGSPGSGTDCTGGFAFDFTAFAASGVDPQLVSGQPVWVQLWSRDPGLPPGQASSLTDAVLFRLCP